MKAMLKRHLVVVGNGGAYDLRLTARTPTRTNRAGPTSQAVVDTFITQRAHVAACVKQQLEADAKRVPAPATPSQGRFMVIQQAMDVSARTRRPLYGCR